MSRRTVFDHPSISSISMFVYVCFHFAFALQHILNRSIASLFALRVCVYFVTFRRLSLRVYYWHSVSIWTYDKGISSTSYECDVWRKVANKSIFRFSYIYIFMKWFPKKKTTTVFAFVFVYGSLICVYIHWCSWHREKTNSCCWSMLTKRQMHIDEQLNQ